MNEIFKWVKFRFILNKEAMLRAGGILAGNLKVLERSSEVMDGWSLKASKRAGAASSMGFSASLSKIRKFTGKIESFES